MPQSRNRPTEQYRSPGEAWPDEKQPGSSNNAQQLLISITI